MQHPDLHSYSLSSSKLYPFHGHTVSKPILWMRKRTISSPKDLYHPCLLRFQYVTVISMFLKLCSGIRTSSQRFCFKVCRREICVYGMNDFLICLSEFLRFKAFLDLKSSLRNSLVYIWCVNKLTSTLLYHVRMRPILRELGGHARIPAIDLVEDCLALCQPCHLFRCLPLLTVRVWTTQVRAPLRLSLVGTVSRLDPGAFFNAMYPWLCYMEIPYNSWNFFRGMMSFCDHFS